MRQFIRCYSYSYVDKDEIQRLYRSDSLRYMYVEECVLRKKASFHVCGSFGDESDNWRISDHFDTKQAAEKEMYKLAEVYFG